LTKDIRVRFAPSPTGSLHIGGARTALFNWLFARHHGGSLILRIDDTDLARSTEESTRGILSALRWLGLDWDEGPDAGGSYGPYFQSQRLELYTKIAQELVDQGRAYYCYCTPEELAERRKQAMAEGKAPRYDGRCRELTSQERIQKENEGHRPAIRLRIPDAGETVVQDFFRGDVVFANDVLDDFIIIKSNGMPTYNFACVVDDAKMQISHILRAEEHLSNTPRQILIYQALGYPLPIFAHVPMILAPDRSKLSKRHGATSVEEFRDMGYLPEALINYLALLGWSPEGEEEILSLPELVRQFTLERVGKTAAVYDVKKLTWMNGHYLNERARKGGIKDGENRKNIGFMDLLKPTKLSWPFKKKKGAPKTEDDEVLYPLDKAKEHWKKAVGFYRVGRHDQATIQFRGFVEMLLKANCTGFISSTENNLLTLSNKAFGEVPAEIRKALTYINPHYTLVKSVYSPAFADDIYEKSKMIAEWVFSQSSSYNQFNLEIE
jgi:glutamyl-tRNA synthetase